MSGSSGLLWRSAACVGHHLALFFRSEAGRWREMQFAPQLQGARPERSPHGSDVVLREWTSIWRGQRVLPRAASPHCFHSLVSWKKGKVITSAGAEDHTVPARVLESEGHTLSRVALAGEEPTLSLGFLPGKKAFAHLLTPVLCGNRDK